MPHFSTDIARACKVSNPTVYGWMSGKTINIEAQNLLTACKLLGVSPFQIMFEDNSESEITMLPGSTTIPAMEAVRLIALYAQATDDGRRRIIDLAGAVERRGIK